MSATQRQRAAGRGGAVGRHTDRLFLDLEYRSGRPGHRMGDTRCRRRWKSMHDQRSKLERCLRMRMQMVMCRSPPRLFRYPSLSALTDGDPAARRRIPSHHPDGSTPMEAPSGLPVRTSSWTTDAVNGSCLAAIDCVILMGFTADDGLDCDAAWRLVSFMISPDSTHPTRVFNDLETEINNPP